MAECTECKHCNLGAYHSGKWYCRSPKVSVFNLPIKIEECYEPKEDYRRRRNNHEESI